MKSHSYLHMTTRALLTFFTCVCSIIILASCALTPGPALTRIQLQPKMPLSFSLPEANKKQLVVAMPSAGSDIDTDAIALIVHQREVRYLAGIRWTSSVPRLVQTSLIDALESTMALRGVMDESAGLAANAKVTCDIKRFALIEENRAQAPTAVIQMTFKIINLTDGTISGTLPITAAAQATGKDNQSLISAYETALSEVLAKATPWIVHTVAQVR